MEIWKDIPNYEGYYQISNLGRVKSLSRIIYLRGKHPFKSKERIRSTFIINSGYKMVMLYKDSKYKSFSIHRLVACVFIENNLENKDLVVNHKNFIRTDNRVENLEWVTHRENSNTNCKNKSSSYRGVSFHKSTGKWSSNIIIDGKKIYLGIFDKEEDAHYAYSEKLKTILQRNI